MLILNSPQHFAFTWLCDFLCAVCLHSPFALRAWQHFFHIVIAFFHRAISTHVIRPSISSNVPERFYYFGGSRSLFVRSLICVSLHRH